MVFVSDADSPAGSWSSVMHNVCPQSCSPPAEFRLLPMIDMIDRLRLCKAALDGELSMDSLESSDCLFAIEQFYEMPSCKLTEASRTAKLWLNYVRHVSLLKLFIRAERTGDWNLHLSSQWGMIPLFAATGHNNYAKSA